MNRYDLFNLIYYMFYGLILVPLAIGARHWPRLDRANRLLWGWLAVLLGLELVAIWLYEQVIRNHFMFYANTLAVLWIGALFYNHVKGWRWPIWVAAGLSLLLPLEVWGRVGFNHINTVTLTLSRILLLVCSFRALQQLVDQPEEPSLRQSPYFYQHTGLFVYSILPAGSYFFKDNFIETNIDLFYFFDTFEYILAGIGFVLLGIGFYTSSRQGVGPIRQTI